VDSTPIIRVLVVDDQPIVGEAVRRMLARVAGVEFHYCGDASDALATAQRIVPTVILQDLVMPGFDGLELVSAYRATAATRDVPLVVLSSRDDPEVKRAAFERGANDYLVKLPHESELVARIRYHSTAYNRMIERDRAFREVERQSRFIRSVFGRYLSDEIVDSLLDRPGGLTLGGERRRVTVLMADLRGFTTMSERLAPEAVVAVLNGFLEVMTDVILDHGGTIDEILGDATLVIFGAPSTHPDHARRAVAFAIDMQLAQATVNAQNQAAGLPAVEMGIGVHTGDVVAGNIGSRRRAKYGVVGPTVNLTARIESYTVGGQILISEATRLAAGHDLRIDSRLVVTPKGVPAPITLHELGGIGGERPRALPLRDRTVLALGTPIPVVFDMLEGKHLDGQQRQGALTHASEAEAEVRCERPPRAFTDVRIELHDGEGEIYGKVMPWDREDSGFRVRFTSISPATAAWLARRLERG
jgi:adenylate cyclase